MTTLTRESLIETAQALLALADAMAPAEPLSFFGTVLQPGEGWRQMLAIAEAERVRNLLLDAPFGRYPTGEPKAPPALAACALMIDVATQEQWPGPRNERWSKWHYLRGIRQLGVGAPAVAEPEYPLERHLQQFEDDVIWLGQSEAGQAWLSHPENRAVTDPVYVRRFGWRPVERARDGSLVEAP